LTPKSHIWHSDLHYK